MILHGIFFKSIHNYKILIAGLVLLLVLFLTIAYKKWKGKPDETKNKVAEVDVRESVTGIPKPKWKKPEIIGNKKEDIKSDPKTWKKPLGVKSTKDENISSTSSNKWKRPDQKIPTIASKDVPVTKKEEKSSWLSSPKKTPELKFKEAESLEDKTKTNKTSESITQESKFQEEKTKVNWAAKKEAGKEAVVQKRQLIIRPERDEKKEAEEFEKELRETEKRAEAEAKSFMRPINLNIDKSARSKEESKKNKEKELNLVRKLCGEFRDVAKLDGQEEKEEKRKEMEKVRSAR